MLSTIKMIFRKLNMLAFMKILKKFDKVCKWSTLKSLKIFHFGGHMRRKSDFLGFVFQVTGKEVLPIYLKVVESSYFDSSDKVNH